MRMHAIASTSSSHYVAASLAVLICGYQPAPAAERYRATCPHSPLSLICPISIQPPGPFIPNTHTCTWLLCSAAHKQSSKSDIIQDPASEKSCADAVKRRLLPVVTTEDRKWGVSEGREWIVSHTFGYFCPWEGRTVLGKYVEKGTFSSNPHRVKCCRYVIYVWASLTVCVCATQRRVSAIEWLNVSVSVSVAERESRTMSERGRGKPLAAW